MIIETNRIPFGLSGASLKTLCHLAEVGECYTGGIVKLTGFSSAGVTELLDRLERDGWIERIRSIDDRRVVMVRLTKDGERMVEGLKPQAELVTA